MPTCPNPLRGIVFAVVLASGPLAFAEAPAPKEGLSMSPAVACRSIEGFEDYEALPEAALTSDEKLLVYYRPGGFRTEPCKGGYRAHFVQDAKIRRKGEKAVLMSKSKLLDYEAKSAQPPELIFLRNTISLKGLKPGEYELDIILHDKVAGTPPATQALPFRVIAAPPPDEAGSGGTREEAR